MSSEHCEYSPYRKMVFLIILGAVWLLWSGESKPLLLGLGVLSCVLTYIIVHRMGYFDDRYYAVHFNFRYITYLIWLCKEVIKSSLDVAKIVLDPKLPISPKIVEIKANSDRPVEQVILANSITLTPGTLSLDLHEGVIRVHALTESGAEELLKGEMNDRVSKLRPS